MYELKHCPFCKSNRIVIVREEVHSEIEEGTLYSAECLNCGARSARAPRAEYAIARWNMRKEKTDERGRTEKTTDAV